MLCKTIEKIIDKNKGDILRNHIIAIRPIGIFTHVFNVHTFKIHITHLVLRYGGAYTPSKVIFDIYVSYDDVSGIIRYYY